MCGPAEQYDADGGQDDVAPLSRGSRQRGGETERPEQFDRHGDAEWQAGDGFVEAHVHCRQNDSEQHDHPPVPQAPSTHLRSGNGDQHGRCQALPKKHRARSAQPA